MARQRGRRDSGRVSLTKNGDGSYTLSVNMEKQIEEQPINRDSHRGWINYGVRNDYPMKLANLYYNSPTHKACCDFAAASVLGDGVDYKKMGLDNDDTLNQPSYMGDWGSLIYDLALDNAIFGGFALQVIKNNDDKTYSFFHQPFGSVRFSPPDEDGVVMTYWISEDWTAVSKNPPVEIPAFGFQEDEEIERGKAYLFVSHGYSPEATVYPIPLYTAATKAIQSEIELQRFDLRCMLNNFCASGILTLNRVDDEAERKALIDNIQTLFVGSDNANSLIINFKSNDEETPAVFTKIEKDSNGDVDLFSNLNDRVISKIVASHRIPNKSLIGFDAESAMLGGSGNLLSVAFNLYNKTVVTRMRDSIVKVVNNALRLNGIDAKIVLKPLSLNIVESEDNQDSASYGTRWDDDSVSERATSSNKNEL